MDLTNIKGDRQFFLSLVDTYFIGAAKTSNTIYYVKICANYPLE